VNYPPITLPDDPKLALQEIASYIRSVRDGRDRAHYQADDPQGLVSELAGYYQTPEWIEGLKQCAAEAERVAAQSEVNATFDTAVKLVAAHLDLQGKTYIEIALDPKTKQIATSFTATLNQSAS
jgi:hypothetical protein